MTWLQQATWIGQVATAIGGLSGLIAVLTFLFAARRDRKSRATDFALRRAEEVRASVEEYIFNDQLLKMKRISRNGVVERYQTPGIEREDIREFRRLLNERDSEIDNAYANQMRCFSRATILVSLSYHKEHSDDLIDEMGKSPLNLDQLASKTAAYIDAEMSRIISGRPAKYPGLASLKDRPDQIA